ncbi:MAG: alpha/beta fold hydrolase [Alphaproteobacteria bacterium]|nr:alpha/beta fold hydrolase [Alphaproteobacteria bacterium]
MEHFWYNLRNRFVKAYNSGYLPEQDGHKIFFQEVGNPNGEPVICFHAGPGGCGKVSQAYSYNLKKYRVVIFDQRGCGLSICKDAFKNNTIQKTVDDANRLLDFLKIKTKVIVSGTSWGSTCALVFAETYPEKAKRIIVNAIFLGRKKDGEYLTPVTRLFYPDMLGEIKKVTGKVDPDKYFSKLLFSEKYADQQKAMKYYETLDYITSSAALSYEFKNREYTAQEIHVFRIYMHYQLNHSFLKENQILKNITKIKDIPTEIYQNRWDPSCPPYQAYELYKALPKSRLHIIPVQGHLHPEMFWQMYQDNMNDYAVIK